LDRRPPQRLIVAQCSDTIGSVIASLRQHNISQVPVVNSERKLLGMVAEVDLLQYLLNQNGSGGMEVSLEDSGVIEADPPVATLDTPLDALLTRLTNQNQSVVIVKEGEEVRDIITKIDLID